MNKSNVFLFLLFIFFCENTQIMQAQELPPTTDNFFNAVLCADGTVQSCGQNVDGQLGLGFESSGEYYFATIPNFAQVKAISIGGDHMLALKCDGTVWSWGNNYSGQLGLGTTGGENSSPVQIPNLENVVQISAGAFHSMALLDDGRVMIWGKNSYGQLGNGSTTDSYSPIEVEGIENAIDISVQRFTSIALLEDGTVRCWGKNNFGNLGIGTTNNNNLLPQEPIGVSNVKDIESGEGQTFAILENGTVMVWGENSAGVAGIGYAGNTVSTPTLIPDLNNVIDIASGDSFATALLVDGTIMVWGSGIMNGLCTFVGSNIPVLGPSIDGVFDLQVSASSKNVVAYLEDNSVRIWGSNNYGQIGIGIADMGSGCSPQEPIGVCGVGDIGLCQICPELLIGAEAVDCCMSHLENTLNEQTNLLNISLIDDRPAYVVAENETWYPESNPFVENNLIEAGTPLYMEIDLVIPEGVSLNLYQMNIHFASQCRLLVEKGGSLKLHGIDSEPTVLKGMCGAVWQGVQVEGPGEDAIRGYLSSSNYNYGSFENVSFAQIEDAIVGLSAMKLPLMETNDLNLLDLPNFAPLESMPSLTSSYLADYVNSPLAHASAGGVVNTIKGIVFENCFQGVNLSWYKNVYGQGNNICVLSGGVFKSSSLAYPFSEMGTNAHKSEVGIMLNNYDYLTIGGLAFANNQFLNQKYGLRAVEATHVSIERNYFENCEIGASIFNGFANSFNDEMLIQDNAFENSKIAIQASGVSGLQINSNYINENTPLAFNTIGLFLRASGFEVENNKINNVLLGTVLLSNHTPASYLKLNKFNNTVAGVWALGANYPDVQLSCNDFNQYAVALLIDDYEHPFLPLFNEEGAFSDQGSCGGINEHLANNVFNGSTNAFNDIISNIDQEFTYLVDLNESLPLVNNANLVNLEDCIGLNSDDCASGIIADDEDIISLINESETNKAVIQKTRHYAQNDDMEAAQNLLEEVNNTQSKKLLIQQYIENGNHSMATSTLNEYLEESNDDEYYNLYNQYNGIKEEERKLWEMTSTEEANVRAIAQTNQATSYDAQTILFLAYGEEFPIELPALPDFLSEEQLNIIFKVGEQSTDSFSYEFYPNPSIGELYVDCQLSSSENLQMDLYSLEGKLMHSQNINQGSNQIKIDQLPTGPYYYQISSKEDIQKGKITIIK